MPTGQAKTKIGQGAPKTEACPINGGLFTKAERLVWENRRPLAVMVENHADSRPQSGLSSADVVYEAVAEGGITRFLSIFYCGAVAEDVKIAPVRSSRVYFINLASEYGEKPIYVHVGGANDFSGSGDTAREAKALELLGEIGWRYPGGNDFDPNYDGQFPVFWRDYERLTHPVATEHTMVSTTEKLWAEAGKRGLINIDSKGNPWDKIFTRWSYKKETALADRGNVAEIKMQFWGGYEDYFVDWKYDRENNQYLRFNGNQPQKDLNNDQQLSAKVVVAQFVKERGPLDRNKHMMYDVIGKGKATIFQDGQAAEGAWAKASRKEKTKFFDAKGREVSFNGGLIWIEILPINGKVAY